MIKRLGCSLPWGIIAGPFVTGKRQSLGSLFPSATPMMHDQLLESLMS